MSQQTILGKTIAGYRLLERVGEGGTAEVYRAEHPEHGRCAVKILRPRLRNDPTAIKRFLREASYGGRVQHTHVVRTHDYGEFDGVHYLALEWANGEPLATFVHRSGPLAPALVAKIISQLADALAATHAVGIIHRDLKPENIMYDPANQVAKLLDFGIARDAELPPEERLTRAGFFVGTLQYVAPETLSGELVSELADIYSLATITYFLLTATVPFSGNSPREVFQQLLSDDPPPLNRAAKGVKFSAALEAAVMRGLRREPTERQQSVQDFAADMHTAVQASGGLARKPGLWGSIMDAFGKH